MSDQDTTEIPIEKNKEKEESNNIKVNETNYDDINKEKSCEKILKQKISKMKKSINFGKSKLSLNFNSDSFISTNKEISITHIGFGNKTIDNYNKKSVKFVDSLGKNLVEYIDIECLKKYNIQYDNESLNISGYQCYCVIY